MTVRWGSLIASPDGEIDYARVKALLSCLLAFGAGVVLTAAMTGVLTTDSDVLMIGVGAMVLPLTGGMVTSGVGALFKKSS